MVSAGHTIFIAVSRYHNYVAYLIMHVWYRLVTIFTAVGRYHIYIAYLIMHVWYRSVTPFLLQLAGTTST
jgi:hypothetical protein